MQFGTVMEWKHKFLPKPSKVYEFFSLLDQNSKFREKISDSILFSSACTMHTEGYDTYGPAAARESECQCSAAS